MISLAWSFSFARCSYYFALKGKAPMWAVSSVVERLVYTEDVGGSNPSLPSRVSAIKARRFFPAAPLPSLGAPKRFEIGRQSTLQPAPGASPPKA